MFESLLYEHDRRVILVQFSMIQDVITFVTEVDVSSAIKIAFAS